MLTNTLPSLILSDKSRSASLRWDRLIILGALLSFWAMLITVLLRMLWR